METTIIQADIIDKNTIIAPANSVTKINLNNQERLLSFAGGIALSTFAYYNRKNTVSKLSGLVAAGLLFRGVTGHCPINSVIGRDTAKDDGPVISISSSLTVNKPRMEVYKFWRTLEQLPSFLTHIQNVKEVDPTRSNWEASFGSSITRICWTAEIIKEEPGHILSWKSEKGSTIDNAGEVRFADAPENSGTEVTVALTYRAPIGYAGAAIARLFNPSIERMVKEDIRKFKQLIESGEIPTIDGQPSGRSRVSDLTDILI